MSLLPSYKRSLGQILDNFKVHMKHNSNNSNATNAIVSGGGVGGGSNTYISMIQRFFDRLFGLGDGADAALETEAALTIQVSTTHVCYILHHILLLHVMPGVYWQ